MKHVLRYLRGTIHYELCYMKCADGVTLVGYGDADWASATDDRRGTNGGAVILQDRVHCTVGSYAGRLVPSAAVKRYQ